MGYMTTVAILNDGFSGIKDSPKDFIAAISDAFCGCKNGYHDRLGVYTYYVGNCGNNVQLTPSYHADNYKLFLCGQNLMSDLTKVYGIENRKDIEFQLSQIKHARMLLDFSEKELKKELNRILESLEKQDPN